MQTKPAYAASLSRGGQKERVVLLMTHEELGRLDEWGVPAGMPSRSEAIRTLIKKGLEAVTNGAR